MMASRIAFDITGDRFEKLTGAALLALEKRSAGEVLTWEMKLEYMACFMADAKGKLLGREKAMAALLVMRGPEINAAFGELMEAMTDKAVPPPNGKPSETPEKAAAA